MTRQIYHRRVLVDGINIFYREAGDRNNRAILLLHGFPTSSLMFKNLMVALSDRFYLVAPDYPGFGFSDFPDEDNFSYSFDNIAICIRKFTESIGLDSFSIYLHDYGCPIGLRVCVKNPERIEGIIVQNGNAYLEGLGPQWDETRNYWENPTEEKKQKVASFLSKEGVQLQYTSGLPEELLSTISPESSIIDWERMSREGNTDMQFQLNCSYQSNLKQFPVFQRYFRTFQPPALVIWGRWDTFFDVEEAHCYKRDLPEAQIHLLEGGHMALETNFPEVVKLMTDFLSAL